MNENQNESKFVGGFWHLVGLYLGGLIICFITLGIAFPWVCCWFVKFYTDQTIINGKRLQFNGNGLSLFGHFILKGWLLGLILGPLTLGLYWIYYYSISLKKWIVKNTSFEGEENQNTSIENSSQSTAISNPFQNKLNKILISGIIGVAIILIGIIYILIIYRFRFFNIRMIINIPVMCGLIASILCFVSINVKIKIIPLISGILFSISSIYSIIFMIMNIARWGFHFRSIINFNILFIILAIFCFLEFIKNKNQNM
jgi:hypothetical protein